MLDLDLVYRPENFASRRSTKEATPSASSGRDPTFVKKKTQRVLYARPNQHPGPCTFCRSAAHRLQTALAAAHGVSAAQVVLRWALQRGCSVLPKSSQPARLAENLALTGFALSDAEMEAIGALDQRRRFNDPGVFCLGMGAFCPIFD